MACDKVTDIMFHTMGNAFLEKGMLYLISCERLQHINPIKTKMYLSQRTFHRRFDVDFRRAVLPPLYFDQTQGIVVVSVSPLASVQ